MLLAKAVKKFPKGFEATRYKSITVASVGNAEYTIANTNAVVDQIPGLVASKTGYTELAGGNLVVLFDAGPQHPIVISVLGSTREGRFTDVLALVDATLSYLHHSE